MGTIEAEIHRLAGHEFNVGSGKQLGEVLFDQMGLAGGRQDEDRRLGHRCRACSRRLPSRATSWPRACSTGGSSRSSRATYADALVERDQPGNRARAHELHDGGHLDRPARLHRPQPAEHPGALPRRPGRGYAGPSWPARAACWSSADYSQIDLRVLAHVSGDETLSESFPQERGHPPAHGQRGLPPAARAGRQGDAPARQGDQFRHRLRAQTAFGLAAVAGHTAGRGRALHRHLLRPLPGDPRLHGAGEGRVPRTNGYRASPPFGRRGTSRGFATRTRRGAATPTGGDQRAAARRGRRYHQAGDGENARRTHQGRAPARGCSCRCTTNCCSRRRRRRRKERRRPWRT